MKVRVKFCKEGAMKFIGHLDIMRYFQKAVRRAGIDVAYSEGFSPHMIMSFAAPLGVGITSTGEYFDMEIKTPVASAEAVERLNQVMAEGMKVLSFRKVPDGKAGKAMSLVAAADYQVRFRPGMEPCGDWREKAEAFLAQQEIVVLKKTKKNEKEVDIKPFLYAAEIREEELFLQLAAGSVKNTKPELVLEAFYHFCGKEFDPYALLIHRSEVYADTGEEGERKLVPLEALGEDI
ncbi:MAG TPA: TIGR03936 family radical SAM-associated protein [Candidatus Blautia merdavium]|uniref:TIGR03936 family radical SAM-associated protein n=1 Tax=Candidatus Blautia merdavium TaxID=2838494 RepID=A0A9D2PJ41_9FIRM|nr:TIGR03936 family radical SAM-associated protein [Candidatus Blautia merdavium]